MANKKPGFVIWIFVAFALFLVVPLLVEEDENIAKRKTLTIEEGSLPVVASENPLEKYLARLADFYGFPRKGKSSLRFAKAGSSANSADSSALSAEGGAVFSPDAKKSAEGKSAYEDYYDDYEYNVITADKGNIRSVLDKAAAAALAEGKITTGGGLVLKPSQDGYELDGKFYKNGTYPSAKSKKDIENALSKFHRAKASERGLTAAYFRNPDGSMVVQYIPEDYFNKNEKQILFASQKPAGDYYKGARILSKNSGGSSSFGGGSAKGSNRSANKNIEEVFGEVSQKVKDYSDSFDSSKANAATRAEEERNSSVNKDAANLYEELLENSPVPRNKLKNHSEPDADANKLKNLDDYMDALTLFATFHEKNGSHHSMEDFLRRLGVKINGQFQDFHINMSSFAEQKEAQKDKHRMQDQTGSSFSKVFLPRPVNDDVAKAFGNRETTYFAYPRTPYMEVDKNGQPINATFSRVFMDRTGIANMLDAMNVTTSGEKFVDYDDLMKNYSKLDERRIQNGNYLNIMSTNQAIRERIPKVVFYLGKEGSSKNIYVASPSSFLYVYAPGMAPDFIARGGSEQAFQSMTSKRFLEEVSRAERNNIIVVENPKIKETLIKSGAKNVVVIPSEVLSSGMPNDINIVIDSLSESFKRQIASDEVLREEFLAAMAALNKDLKK